MKMRFSAPLVLLSLQAHAAEQETMTVHGSKLFQEPGSSTVIREEQLETYKYSDLNRILKTVPGVQIQEEDGFGLAARGDRPHRVGGDDGGVPWWSWLAGTSMAHW